MNKAALNQRDTTGATLLFEAVSCRDFDEVERLLTMGADANIPDNNGTTPLMEAAALGSLRLIRLLVSRGAKIQVRDKFSDSALDYARNQKHPKAVKLLEELAVLEAK